MANFKYFSDVNGVTVELKAVTTMPNKEFVEKFPGVKGRNCGGYDKMVGCDVEAALTWPRIYLPVTRAIEYKSNPSKHECNAKCMNGSCRGVCECRCGGKNHGRGTFTSLLEKSQQQ
jgi:hypothetical protein